MDDKHKPSKVQSRVIKSAVEIALDPASEKNAVFQHSVLCQTCLPYRNPGDDVTRWERKQGKASLLVTAGSILDPKTREWIDLGLPYGAKARLILAHINTQAIKSQSRIVDVGDSMTQFVKRLGLANKGDNFNIIKDQLARLTVASITLAYSDDDQYKLSKSNIIEELNVWFPKDENQRVLWQSTIELGERYYSSLSNHAVPLDERALAALSHNCLALDVYTWLAQRLHRVNPAKPDFVDWNNLKQQFGPNYKRMDDFKRRFRKYLDLTLTQYPEAKLEEVKNRGFRLFHSKPPIKARVVVVNGLKPSK